MEELYFFESKSNKTKSLIVIVILLLLGISAIAGFLIYTHLKKTETNIRTYLVDNTFNINIKDSYNLTEYKTADYFLLELHSNKNLNFYIRKLENLDNYSLFMITKNDCLTFTQNFENVTETSNINYSNINNFESCNYNFKYTDPTINSTYFIQVYLIKIGNSIYSLTADFPFDNIDIFNPIVNDIVNSIFI